MKTITLKELINLNKGEKFVYQYKIYEICFFKHHKLNTEYFDFICKISGRKDNFSHKKFRFHISKLKTN